MTTGHPGTQVAEQIIDASRAVLTTAGALSNTLQGFAGVDLAGHLFEFDPGAFTPQHGPPGGRPQRNPSRSVEQRKPRRVRDPKFIGQGIRQDWVAVFLVHFPRK
jgi:hypothetical protein